MLQILFQCYGKLNTGDLVLNKNMDGSDFTSRLFVPKPFTHQTTANEVEVSVNGNTTILQGVYKDKLGEIINDNFKYKVNLYVWMEAVDN